MIEVVSVDAVIQKLPKPRSPGPSSRSVFVMPTKSPSPISARSDPTKVRALGADICPAEPAVLVTAGSGSDREPVYDEKAATALPAGLLTTMGSIGEPLRSLGVWGRPGCSLCLGRHTGRKINCSIRLPSLLLCYDHADARHQRRDFADIYLLTRHQPVDGSEPRESILQVARHRITSLAPLGQVLAGYGELGPAALERPAAQTATR